VERTLRSYLWPAVGYFVVLEFMTAAAILFWPNFEESIDSIRGMVPLASLRDMVDAIAQGGVAAYVNGQHFFKGCNTLGVAAAVLFAMGAVAGEAHRGTLELWLSQPYSRTRLLLERYVAGALAFGLPIFLSSATLPWFLARVDEQMAYGSLMLSSLHEWLFLLTIYSATFLLSCLSSRPIWIALVMLFLTTLQFAIYLVKVLTGWSIFRVVDIDDFQRIYNRDTLNWTICGPLLAISAVLLVASHVAFARRVP
jgi:ABC-type transport system involved in multi-copper enzyme maturation permease subunit